ncbi:MAG: putative exosortase B-associated extracellular polysaccharide biosynthesis transporter EpsL, partial [Burkholderiales bacterium]|nr:putative exosortase B-associated extracellular polysaccharide biosynthesis transporter EpsL [Burkholderiales bacterium]
MRPRRTARRGSRRAALGLALAGAAWPAAADQFDTLNVNVGATVLFDDNVFRLSSGADPNRLIGSPTKADTITVTTAGLRLSKPVSLQRFELGLNLVDYRYDRFKFLSFTARNYDAAWRWSLTPRFSGSLSADRNQALSSFADFTGFVRNLRTVETQRLTGSYEIDGVWRLVGGASRTETANSQVFIADFDNRLSNVEGGLRYQAPSGSFAQLVARAGSGDFFKRPAPLAAGLLDTKFRQNELEGRLRWQATGKSSVNARLAWLERSHENFAQRDYSGWVGSLDADWGLTGKTSIAAGVRRDLASFQLASSSFTRAHRLYVGPTWEVSAKAVARARLEVSTRDFLGAVANTPQ